MSYVNSSNKGAKRRMNRGHDISNDYYVDGNAVRKLEQEHDDIEERRRQAEEDRRRAIAYANSVHTSENLRRRKRNKIKTAPMNKLYVGAMVVAVAAVCTILMGYVKLQSDITNHINQISKLENEYNELKLSNDELYTQIMSDVDLEEIRSIAINELGMKYAKEGQVVTYSSEGNDFVRQYSDIPNTVNK